MLTDSHCHLDHLDLAPYSGDLNTALLAARGKGVKYILSPGIDLPSSAQAIKIANEHPDIFASIGVHPTEDVPMPTLNELLEYGQQPKVVAIGETGLDYHYVENATQKFAQQELLRLHIRAALELKKPIILHSREAAADILKILTEERASEVGGVFHCFTEDLAMAAAGIALNFYVSFSGIITFRNADSLRATAKTLPLDKILIETDAPYLAPVPMRGKPNEPIYLPYVAEKLAELRGVTYEAIAKQTTENFLHLLAGEK